MPTTRRYGNTSPKKNCAGSSLNDVMPDAIMSPMTTGTELTDARAANTARRGGVGTTTVNRTIHTATHERQDRKSTRLNSSHGYITYGVLCLEKKKIDL